MNVPPATKSKTAIVALAFLGAFQPTPLPLAGLHKFYLGQYGWGAIYLVLGITQLPRIACLAEGLWYLVGLSRFELGGRAVLETQGIPGPSPGPSIGETMTAVADSLREIEQLRREGLLSEHEFEQKRRSLLEQIP